MIKSLKYGVSPVLGNNNVCVYIYIYTLLLPNKVGVLRCGRNVFQPTTLSGLPPMCAMQALGALPYICTHLGS